MILPRIMNFPAEWKPGSNWIIRLSTRLVIFFILASLLYIAFFWNKLPPMIPLWLSSPWGSDQLAHPGWLFILPLGGLLMYFINLLISMYIQTDYLVFIQILFLSAVLVNALAFIALIQIVALAT